MSSFCQAPWEPIAWTICNPLDAMGYGLVAFIGGTYLLVFVGWLIDRGES